MTTPRAFRAAIAAPLLLAALLWAAGARAEDVYVTVPWKDEQIQIRARVFHPAGPGPFPGVILLHHCGGLTGYDAGGPLAFYTSMLVQQGYAVAAPDSFTARHVVEDCAIGAVTPLDRAHDVFAVAELMATRPDIKASKIGIVGWSHGATSAVYIARDWPQERPLRESLAAKGAKITASVGLYGGNCGNAEKAAIVTDGTTPRTISARRWLLGRTGSCKSISTRTISMRSISPSAARTPCARTPQGVSG